MPFECNRWISSFLTTLFFAEHLKTMSGSFSCCPFSLKNNGDRYLCFSRCVFFSPYSVNNNALGLLWCFRRLMGKPKFGTNVYSCRLIGNEQLFIKKWVEFEVQILSTAGRSRPIIVTGNSLIQRREIWINLFNKWELG